METVFVALVVTESADTYTWVYKDEPTRDQIIDTLMEYEGADPDERDWYSDCTSITLTVEVVR